MLKKYAHFFVSLFFISDLLILSLFWILSYLLRFYTDFIKPPILGTPSFLIYVKFLLPLWLIWGFVSKEINLYRPRRMEHFFKEYWDITKCLTLTFLFFISVLYLFRRFEFSRLAFVYWWVMSFLGLGLSRLAARRTLRIIRKKGYNKRFAVIAGTGKLGQTMLEKIELYPELGIQVIGFLTRKKEEVGKTIRNIPILALYENLEQVLSGRNIDIFFVALSIHDYDCLENLLKSLQGRLSDIKVIPGAYEFMGLRGGVDDLGGLPILSLQNSPLFGWHKVTKRIFDLVLGTAFLILTSPLIVVISLLIKLTSPGPVLYRQERIGMNGRSFQMLKFRTMKNDAEKETGPVWAKQNDPRRTGIGAFLRKTSLDELPQLLNVLRGEMSLVGPRPERPNFVETFRNGIPSYMLRHKIKAGMTGWAQVNGWRGNTSIEKRIDHDLYYIQNWSIGFDVKVLFMTLWKGFFNRSAY